MTEPLFVRIETVYLPVRNLDRAVQWYRDTMQLEILWKNETAASLKLGETPLTLLKYQFPGMSEPPYEDFEFVPVTEVLFNIFTSDIEAAHKLLEDKDVAVSDIEIHENLRDFIFADLDGNMIGVCTPYLE
ncbi:MAG: VOC family protein [Anaerolineaceae bacterium]|jgi:catechol-2,3-dioxygenase